MISHVRVNDGPVPMWMGWAVRDCRCLDPGRDQCRDHQRNEDLSSPWPRTPHCSTPFAVHSKEKRSMQSKSLSKNSSGMLWFRLRSGGPVRHSSPEEDRSPGQSLTFFGETVHRYRAISLGDAEQKPVLQRVSFITY